MSDISQDRWVTRAAAARELNVSYPTVARLLDDHPSIRRNWPGRQLKLNLADLIRIVETEPSQRS